MELFENPELTGVESDLQSSLSFIIPVLNIPKLLCAHWETAPTGEWKFFTLYHFRLLKTATYLIHGFVTPLNSLALGLRMSHGFKEWPQPCAEQEFSHSGNSGPVNSHSFSTGISVGVCI